MTGRPPRSPIDFQLLVFTPLYNSLPVNDYLHVNLPKSWYSIIWSNIDQVLLLGYFVDMVDIYD